MTVDLTPDEAAALRDAAVEWSQYGGTNTWDDESRESLLHAVQKLRQVIRESAFDG